MNRSRAGAPLQAYVLHHYDWSESSLIVELFTRERGRIAAVAKGAKRPYSQLRAVLLPFQRLNVALGRGADDPQVEVHTLRSAEWAGGAAMPGGPALLPGFYVNELLLRLLARHDPHAALFDAYARSLQHLAAGDEARLQAALRGFELTLLRETGVLPALDRVTTTQRALRPGVAYGLGAETGVGESGVDGAAFDAAQLQALQAALEAGDDVALHAACAAALAPLRAGMRGLLHYHLGTSRLRTRELMTDLRRLLHTPDRVA
jgi:DNA repair protein RecO (recombination protein O)